jgi:hypothetical protein
MERVEEYRAWLESLRSAGRYADGERLAASGTVLGGGGTAPLDATAVVGPAGRLSGFFLIEADTDAQARAVATRPHAQRTRSGRGGSRRRAPRTASTTATDTAPVKVRLTNSIHPFAPVAPRGTSEPSSQVGQVGHPMPDPVSRTAAPETTIAPTATSATAVIVR